MSGFERPAPDLDKIVTAWNSWQNSADADSPDEQALPGRTMADLKIAGIDMVLEAIASDRTEIAPVIQAWQSWERGKVGPDETLAAMADAGLADLVEAFAAAK